MAVETHYFMTVPIFLASSLGVRGLPVSWLLDRDGRILWKAIGSREWDSAAGQAYFDKLLPPARQ